MDNRITSLFESILKTEKKVRVEEDGSEITVENFVYKDVLALCEQSGVKPVEIISAMKEILIAHMAVGAAKFSYCGGIGRGDNIDLTIDLQALKDLVEIIQSLTDLENKTLFPYTLKQD